MTNYPSISIIIPAYNVEDYLSDALNSIKSQTQYPDEVILVDDGSTDTTLKIAESFDFPFKYKVISVNNGGQGRARNLGIELASSEYIYYFDSDDLLHKEFIKNIRQEIDLYEYPDIVLFSGCSFNDKNVKEPKHKNYSRGFNAYFENRNHFLEYSYKKRSLFCQPCCYISKRQLWGNKGLVFPNNYLEDEAIFFPLLFSCKSFRVIDSVMFYRRIRQGSTMSQKPNFKHIKGALNCMHSILDLLELKDLEKSEMKVLRKRLASYCLSYISFSIRAGEKISLQELILALKKTKSTTFLLKAPLLSLKLNIIKLIK